MALVTSLLSPSLSPSSVVSYLPSSKEGRKAIHACSPISDGVILNRVTVSRAGGKTGAMEDGVSGMDAGIAKRIQGYMEQSVSLELEEDPSKA